MGCEIVSVLLFYWFCCYKFHNVNGGGIENLYINNTLKIQKNLQIRRILQLNVEYKD